MELQKEARIVLPPNPEHQLIARIRRVLRSTGYDALSHIRVAVEQNVVRLEGQVPTYFLKQVAQTQVLSINEVRSVINNLVVEDGYVGHF